MTAEVAILNRSAVALAADSKVTVGGGGSEKTYDSVNKIFTLSKVHPIGIMVYGNADFMQFPWETIAKEYRRQKRTKEERTVADWAEDFRGFLQRFNRVSQAQKRENIRVVLRSVFQEIETRAITIAHLRGVQYQSSDYEKILLEEMTQFVEARRRNGPWISNKAAISLLIRFMNVLSEVILEFAPNKKNKKFFDAAVELAGYTLVSQYFSPASSGIVIAGFGRTEVFPDLISYHTEGYIGDRIKFSKPDSAKITLTNTSSVMAFAQHDIVHRFMEGIDPDYAALLRGLFSTALIQSNIKTFEKWAPTSKSKNKRVRSGVVRAADKVYQRILADAMSYRMEQFSRPTLDMVSVLPKDELAKLAESLVDLTSLHRRVARDLETVGGPIDVAVISKGDGFIWVKRKHYFDLELNRHFELNYMRNTEGR